MTTRSITMHGAMRPAPVRGRGSAVTAEPQTRSRTPAGPVLLAAASSVRARPCLAPPPARLRLAGVVLALLANVLVIGGVLGLFAWGG